MGWVRWVGWDGVELFRVEWVRLSRMGWVGFCVSVRLVVLCGSGKLFVFGGSSWVVCGGRLG